MWREKKGTFCQWRERARPSTRLNKNTWQVKWVNIWTAVILRRVCTFGLRISVLTKVWLRARHAENVANNVRMWTRYVTKQHLPSGSFENRYAFRALAALTNSKRVEHWTFARANVESEFSDSRSNAGRNVVRSITTLDLEDRGTS